MYFFHGKRLMASKERKGEDEKDELAKLTQRETYKNIKTNFNSDG